MMQALPGKTPAPSRALKRCLVPGNAPALLRLVLAEARSIQDMSLSGAPVWFKARTIAEWTGLREEKVSQALAELHARGDIATALRCPKGKTKAGLVYALAEAVDNDPPPEAA